MKIIDNFIDNADIVNDIQSTLLGNNFPYFYNNHISEPGDNSDFLFGHMLFHDEDVKSNYFNKILSPILGRLNFNYLIRAKINCYTKKEKHIETGMHVDMNEKHLVALYSVNTNNGYTLFEDGTRVKSIANQMAIFDGRLKHCSVSQTDKNLRLNININLL